MFSESSFSHKTYADILLRADVASVYIAISELIGNVQYINDFQNLLFTNNYEIN